MTTPEDESKALAAWSRRLVDALQILHLEVDQKEILGLAGRAAHAVLRPAAPLTTFIVGYAADWRPRVERVRRRPCGTQPRWRSNSAGWTRTRIRVRAAGRAPDSDCTGLDVVGAAHRDSVSLTLSLTVGAGDGSRRTITDLDTGVLLPSAVESSGTSPFASGKYAAAQPLAVG